MSGDIVERLMNYTPCLDAGQVICCRRTVDEAAAELARLQAVAGSRMVEIVERDESADEAATLIESLRSDNAAMKAALEAIANDPYQHGQRIQRMKASARATLSSIQERG